MKALIAGLGGIGQRHVRNLRTLLGGEVEILAYRIRKLDRVLTEEFEIEEGIPVEDKYNIEVYADLDRALEQKPHAVLVCNPTSLHLPVALAAARAGCHLFIEKPLSHNYDDVEELISLVERQRLIALVGYQMRFHPALMRLRSLLCRKSIGRVLAVNVEVGEYLPGWHPYEDYRAMYASRSDFGGGAILSQIHELDYLYWLFGVPSRVFAMGGHLSSLEIDVEDVAAISMEFNVDGRNLPVHVHQDYLQRPPSRTCRVIGDAGKIIVDFNVPSLQVFDVQGQLSESRGFDGFKRNQMFLDETKHFLACIAGKEEPVVNLRAGAQSLRMALAAKESLQTGKAVELS
jgi:predicted dehydrogenase